MWGNPVSICSCLDGSQHTVFTWTQCRGWSSGVGVNSNLVSDKNIWIGKEGIFCPMWWHVGQLVPLVVTPIQFRYLVSFLEMKVFPLAGSPTITIMVGELVNWGTEAETHRPKMNTSLHLPHRTCGRSRWKVEGQISLAQSYRLLQQLQHTAVTVAAHMTMCHYHI